MPQSSFIVKLPFSTALLQRLESAAGKPNTVPRAYISCSSQVAPASKMTDFFSPEQMSLALAITKSKPDGMSTAEYCKQILMHTKERGVVEAEQYRWINSKEYWKDACDKIHKEKAALEDKIRCLEEAQRLLKDRLHRSENLIEEGWHTGSKSKNTRQEGESPLRVEAGTSRKRAAPSQEILHQDGENAELEDDKYLRLSGYVLQIMHQKAQLEEATKQPRTLNQINDLTKCVNQTISLLEKSIRECCLPLKALKTDKEDSHTVFLLRQLLHHTARSFHACFNALSQLWLTIPGRKQHREIVSRMVMFFKRSLDFLQTVSALQLAEAQIQRDQSTRSKRARWGSEEYAVNKYLTQTLTSILKDLDWGINQTGHGDLLEGILFLTIEHIGRLVSDAVFGEKILASDSPANASNHPNPPKKGVLRLETRYMVQILYAVLGGSDRKDTVLQVLSAKGNFERSSSEGSIATRSESSGSGDILRKVKKQLQATLLQSILGGVELESLSLPKLPSEISIVEDMRDDRELYGKEWLLETVWSLIGWDMVTNDLT